MRLIRKSAKVVFHLFLFLCFNIFTRHFICLFCRGDHTFADSYLTVIPRGTEFVVFSIDGSFAASVSIMGSDPKVRAGAVDVVRYRRVFPSRCLKQDYFCRLKPATAQHFFYLSLQALAGSRLFNHLRDGTAGHAEATSGSLALAAQLSTRYRVLLRRPGPRPTPTQGQLPQVPDRGEAWKRSTVVCTWESELILKPVVNSV